VLMTLEDLEFKKAHYLVAAFQTKPSCFPLTVASTKSTSVKVAFRSDPDSAPRHTKPGPHQNAHAAPCHYRRFR